MRFMLFATEAETDLVSESLGWPIVRRAEEVATAFDARSQSIVCTHSAAVGVRVPSDVVVLTTADFVRNHNGPTLLQALARPGPTVMGPTRVELGK